MPLRAAVVCRLWLLAVFYCRALHSAVMNIFEHITWCMYTHTSVKNIPRNGLNMFSSSRYCQTVFQRRFHSFILLFCGETIQFPQCFNWNCGKGLSPPMVSEKLFTSSKSAWWTCVGHVKSGKERGRALEPEMSGFEYCFCH